MGIHAADYKEWLTMARGTPAGQLVEALAGGLAYDERLRAITAALPAWVAEEMLSASEHIGDDRAAVWFGGELTPPIQQRR